MAPTVPTAKEIWEERISQILEVSRAKSLAKEWTVREKEPGLHVRMPGTTDMDLLGSLGRTLALRGRKPNCREQKVLGMPAVGPATQGHVHEKVQ